VSGRFLAEEVAAKDVERAVLVGADRGRHDWPLPESLAELERLSETAGIEVLGTVTQKIDKPNPRTFIGSGKAEEIADLIHRHDGTMVVFDDDLTPSQQANLEKLIPDAKVLDRTALILDIFAQHAVSREGKLQVQLAQLEYVLPRLKGMWGHLEAERLGGGRGARFGAGESQLETDRRLTRRRIAEVKRELKGVSSERNLQRKRRARSGVYRLSLVGYTNAGKSTLLNRLTDAETLVADMLFATLDSTTRRLELPEGREITLTDTVGFINKLPHGLVEAFRSTLDEVRGADLLLQVADASHPQLEAQLLAVQVVLAEIGAADRPSVLVLNKADRLDDEARSTLTARYPRAVLASALTGQGMESLIERVAEEAARGSVTLTVLLPYTRGDLVQLAHERGQIISERHTGEGTQLVVRIPAEAAHELAPYLSDGSDDSGAEL